MRSLVLHRRGNKFCTAETKTIIFFAIVSAMGSVRSFSPRAPRGVPPRMKAGEGGGGSETADTTPAAAGSQFSFGIIADVQWADAPDGYNYAKTVRRCYRGALTCLENAVDWWLTLPESPLFVAQLGDVIDGMNSRDQLDKTDEALGAALGQLGRLPCPSVNLVGNHELYNFNRKDLTEATWLQHGDKEYYGFTPAEGWRVVVLDPYQIALIGHDEDDPRRLEAIDILARENPNVHPDGRAGDWFEGMEDAGYQRRFVPYNGGFGAEQLSWLRSELKSARDGGERVIVMSHVPIHPEACGGGTMAWDYEEALEAFRSEGAGGCVAAVLCGHDHKGNYHRDDFGVHHCTFVSPLNKGEDGSAFGVMHVKSDRLEIQGPAMDDLLPDVPGRPSPSREKEKDFSASGPSELISLALGDVLAPRFNRGAASEEVSAGITPVHHQEVTEVAA